MKNDILLLGLHMRALKKQLLVNVHTLIIALSYKNKNVVLIEERSNKINNMAQQLGPQSMGLVTISHHQRKVIVF
jgi:hypothetical protein